MAHYRLSGPDIVHEDFDGEIVILNLQTGQYFGLNETGAALWTVVQAGGDPAEVSVEFGATFAARLVELGLVVEDEAAGADVEPQSFSEAPTIEVYSDLSDLILADPIHDVDAEEGWPKLPEAN